MDSAPAECFCQSEKMTTQKTRIINTLDIIEDQPLTLAVESNQDHGAIGVYYVTGTHKTPEAVEYAINELTDAHEKGTRLGEYWGFIPVTKEGAGSLAVALVGAIQDLEEATQ